MKQKLITSFVALVLTSSAWAGGSSTVGLGNPASMNCVKLGGTLELVERYGGQDHNCVIEEWTLFRAMSERGLVKSHRYDRVGMPNPAAVNCIDIKGKLRRVTTARGESAMCVVPQFDLFKAINVLDEE